MTTSHPHLHLVMKQLPTYTENVVFILPKAYKLIPHYTTGWLLNNGPPFYIGFELILIVLANSYEQMPYWLGLGDSFAVLYIAVTCLVQELC